MATTVSRRFAGFVKVKHKRKAVPLPKRTSVLPENDRLVGETPSRPAAPLLARPVSQAAPGSRYKVLLAAMAVVGVAVAGAMMLKSAAAPYSSSPSMSRAESTSSPRSHRRSSGYGDYPGGRGEIETSGPTPSTEESFLAAGYVRGKPQLMAGSATATGKGAAGASAKVAETRSSTGACVVKMDGGVLARDFGTCLRQIDGK